MPAEIDTFAFAGMPAWHGLGVNVPDQMTVREAIKLAKLDWEVETAPIVSDDAKRTAVEDKRITRRVSDNAILGIVSKRFKPIQNIDAFDMLEDVIGVQAGIIDTVGSLRGGSKVFMLAKLNGVLEIGKGVGAIDEIQRYLLLANSHDGSIPLSMLFTPVRVVCQNTLSLAISKNGDDKVTKVAPRVSIRHTSKAAQRMKGSVKMMKSAMNYYNTFGDFANFLYKTQVNTQQVKNIIAEVFPPNTKKEITPVIIGHRSEVERLFVDGKGHDKIAGSAWALLNAFGEYADHGVALRAMSKSKDPSDRGYSILMGGARGLKQRANKVINELAL